MDDRTTLLFALSDYRVLDVTLDPGGERLPCLRGEVGADQDRPTSRVRDLSHGPVPLVVLVLAVST